MAVTAAREVASAVHMTVLLWRQTITAAIRPTPCSQIHAPYPFLNGSVMDIVIYQEITTHKLVIGMVGTVARKRVSLVRVMKKLHAPFSIVIFPGIRSNVFFE